MKQEKLWIIGLLLMFFSFAVAGSAARAAAEGETVVAQVGVEDEEYEEEDAFGGIMNTSIPMISDVSFPLEPPKAGQAVKASCKIVMSEEEEDEGVDVAKAQIVYTTDGRTLQYADMTAGADGVYSGEIPGQAAGTEVSFGIRAVDTTRNVSMEMPVRASWPAAKDVLMPGAKDVDNSGDVVQDDMDFLQTYFGYDDEWVYVGFEVQGNVSSGTLDPPFIQVYGAKFTNPDVDQGEGLMVGKLAIYVPLGAELYERFKNHLDKVGFKFPESKMGVIDIKKIMSDPKEGYVADAAPEAKVDGPLFVGRLKRAALGDNPSGYVRGIYIAAANASLDSFMPIPMNATPYTQLYFNSHSYKVAGGPQVAAAVVAEKKPEKEWSGYNEDQKKRVKIFGWALAITGAVLLLSD